MFSDLGRQALEYIYDAQQRTVLYLDVMRQSGDQYVEHVSQGKPPVLVFEHELVVDGRLLPDPVNYALLRIVPPTDMPTNPEARPFVIIDPRAGHGPGVAGSKIHSEVGVALAAGHPCYFVTFGPDPEPDQSIYCILKAEKHFLEVVAQRHDPARVGKAFVIGNCQGGWALMMLASVAPKLVGPIMLAGAPLAYWSGKSGQNPMRYSGGMLGGSWMSSLASDLGNGIFDGAYLVDNFEKLDPANTFWQKPYHLYANIDTEVERYLGFDRWWAGHFLMTRQEIDWIVQNLFIGNRLSRALLPDPLSDGNINLRNIRSPILVFASEGDNITPPPQALNWIPDMYASDEDIRAHEQVIIYSLHQTTGHLGIFVSAGVANREHEALVGVLDLIDLLPPGLYEARIQDLNPDISHQEWVKGRHLVTFEPRTLEDIRALDDGRSEEADFEVVNRVSQINQHIYDLALSPLMRSLSNSWTAQAARTLNPRRFNRYAWSSLNPLALSFQQAAAYVQKDRRPVAEDNVFLAAERALSDSVARSLATWSEMRDRSIEAIFHGVYGAPWLRALVGLEESTAERRGLLDSDTALHEELHDLRLRLTKAQVNEGGLTEAFTRILTYMAGEEPFVDERAFNLVSSLTKTKVKGFELPDLAVVKQALRKQWHIVKMHPDEAIEALPKLVPNKAQRALLWEAVEEIAQLRGALNVDVDMQARFAKVACALGLRSAWQPPSHIVSKLEREKQELEQEAKAQMDKVVAELETTKKAVAQAKAELQKQILSTAKTEPLIKTVPEARVAVKAPLEVEAVAKIAAPAVKKSSTAKKAAKKATKKTMAVTKAVKKAPAKPAAKKSINASSQASLALSEEGLKPSAAWPEVKKS